MSKLEEALAFHTRGELARAERLYREILEQTPSHFDALQLLGVVEAQKGNHAAAVGLIDRALGINPDHAASHNNRGNSLRALNRHDKALASFDRALELKPDYAMLSDIRSQLARNRTTYPLFDTDRFRRHIEAAFVSMWERYQRGEPPQSFSVTV